MPKELNRPTNTAFVSNSGVLRVYFSCLGRFRLPFATSRHPHVPKTVFQETLFVHQAKVRKSSEKTISIGFREKPKENHPNWTIFHVWNFRQWNLRHVFLPIPDRHFGTDGSRPAPWIDNRNVSRRHGAWSELPGMDRGDVTWGWYLGWYLMKILNALQVVEYLTDIYVSAWRCMKINYIYG